MVASAFKHRSGRVISLSRLVLAGVFLFAIWVDPTQPSGLAEVCYSILVAYLVLGAAYLGATWNDWRLEYRLSLPAHVVDLLVFGVMVGLTEGYTSPFFSFAVFITFSALIKWGWRAAGLTGAAVTIIFFGAGLLAIEAGIAEFELKRFLMRGTYLVVISSVIVWFGKNQAEAQGRRPAQTESEHEQEASLPIRPVMEQTADALQAERVVFAWSESEEPWINVAMLDERGFAEERFPPAMFPALVHPAVSGRPFLFDRRSALARGRGGRIEPLAVAGAVEPALARHVGIEEGIALPVDTDACSGVILAGGIAGLCSDDLVTASALSASSAAALKRASTLQLMEENATSRTRLAFARDLHDSVMQLLAGASLRLEGLRAAAERGEPIGEEIEALQRDLAAEQRGLRRFIDKLRGSASGGTGPVDIRRVVEDTAAVAARQWRVRCKVRCGMEDLVGTPQLEHELRHLLREAIANAVRHGKADTIGVALDRRDRELVLTVEDDGSGCPAARDGAQATDGTTRPKSMHERVAALGGTVGLASTGDGSRLTVTIPMGACA
jgi:signal transduction histidine kinase